PRGHRPRQRHLQRLGVRRLQQVVAGAALQALDGRGDGALAGEDHHRYLRGEGLHLLDQREAVASRQPEVGEHHVHRAPRQLGHGLRHVPRLQHLVAALAQDLAQGLADVVLVLHHQHAAAAASLGRAHAASVWPAAGSVTRKTVPPSSRGSASRTPPCCPTIVWQMDRPRPVEFLVEKKGSKILARSSALIPGPRSAISATARPSSRRELTRTSPPPGCASQALTTRFRATWPSMIGLPTTTSVGSASASSKRTRENSGRERTKSVVSVSTRLRSSGALGASVGSAWASTCRTTRAARSSPCPTPSRRRRAASVSPRSSASLARLR